jgi:hypothetical protein
MPADRSASKKAFKAPRVSLQKFALGKYNNGLDRKRDQNRVDNFKKSAALRKYAKICKEEGVESQRVNVHKQSKSSSPGRDEGDGDGTKDNRDSVTKKKEKKVSKSIPFAKERRIAQESQRSREDHATRQKEKEEEIHKAKNERDSKRRQHMQKTSKGQPVMKTRVLGLLEKIQKMYA